MLQSLAQPLHINLEKECEFYNTRWLCLGIVRSLVTLHVLFTQNVNASQLQTTGKLQILCLSEETSASHNTYTWDQIVAWRDQFQDNCEGIALLVDDVDALELLAPTARAARRFMARAIELLQTSTTEGEHGGLHQLVAFGRHPVEYIADLSGLNNTSRSSGMTLSTEASGGMLSARAPLSEIDQEPALCEYLRYR
jgi:hypothetical protein